MSDDLTHRFTYHPPAPEQPEVYGLIRDTAHLLALVVVNSTTMSRERSLALTAIEEAVMWANAGVARNGLSHASLGRPVSADDVLREAIVALRDAKPHTPLLKVAVVEHDDALTGELLRLTPRGWCHDHDDAEVTDPIPDPHVWRDGHHQIVTICPPITLEGTPA